MGSKRHLDPSADGTHHEIRLGVIEHFECCDCGLTHEEVYIPDPERPGIIHVYSYRDEEVTRKARKRKE